MYYKIKNIKRKGNLMEQFYTIKNNVTTEIVEKKKKQRKAVSFFFYLIKSLANKNESANFLVNVGHLYVIINDIKGR